MMNSRRRRRFAVAALAVVLSAGGAVLIAGQPALAIPGRTNIYAPSQMDSNDKNPVTANCPAGKKVVGGAGYISNGLGNVVLDEIVPSLDLTSVSVQGLEHGSYGGAWSQTAIAMCADPVMNLQRISFEVPSDSTSPKNAIAYCPQNLKVYGLGAQILNGQGDVTLDDLEIDTNLEYVNVGAYEIGGSVTHSWGLIAYAICGNPAATMVRKAASTATNGVSPKSIAAPSCDPGTTATGVGGELTGALGDVTFTQLTLGTQPSGNAKVEGYENGGGSPIWNITAYTVCTS